MNKPPCIALDATLVGKRAKGAGRALKNLVAMLPRVDPASRYVTLAAFDGLAALLPARDVIEVPASRGVLWELTGAGKAARAAGADLLFTVRELTPIAAPPTVVHIYEPPAYRLRPQLSLANAKAAAKDVLLHLELGRSLRRAAAVTAGSVTTATWLRERLGIEARVVYPGIDPIFFVDQKVVANSLRQPYFLHLATGDDRENTKLVLEGFFRAGLDTVRLKLVGVPEDIHIRLQGRARDAGFGDRVDVMGWVSDTELRELYRGAIALLHPTRYESYAGFPALEAMALGTPVIALDAPGSTEALSGAAVLLEREDSNLLAAELRRIAGDEGLRATLAAKGREKARELTWERTARRLADIFNEVLTASGVRAS